MTGSGWNSPFGHLKCKNKLKPGSRRRDGAFLFPAGPQPRQQFFPDNIYIVRRIRTDTHLITFHA